MGDNSNQLARLLAAVSKFKMFQTVANAAFGPEPAQRPSDAYGGAAASQQGTGFDPSPFPGAGAGLYDYYVRRLAMQPQAIGASFSPPATSALNVFGPAPAQRPFDAYSPPPAQGFPTQMQGAPAPSQIQFALGSQQPAVSFDSSVPLTYAQWLAQNGGQ